MHKTYRTKGTCSVKIDFEIDEQGRIHDITYLGGCDGNLKALGKLLEGYDAKKAADTLRGNLCDIKGTSCADQLSKSLDEAVAEGLS